ncbi:MAG: hypothetical protein B6I19_05760 [Bacteroidetes bacterium 4572_114]|nr:MAG: hypothetical protein B6I19_05760 [Bacteroidetes bacterium 4572_114]
MKKVIGYTLIFMFFASLVYSQEKYAVLICGAPVTISSGDEQSSCYNTNTDGYYHWTEFWAEIYNTWELLIKPVNLGGKGFKNDNVYVLYADGTDFSIYAASWIADKYNPQVSYPLIIPPPAGQITNYAATAQNVEMVFDGLAFGQGEFPQLTEDDFLFVWTFGHGISGPPEQYNSYILLYPGGEYSDEDFAEKVNQISCNKKVFWLLQCHSGGFIDSLEGNNTIINTSVPYGVIANVADDLPVFENEIIDTVYHHTEVYFHLYSSENQATPDGRTIYNNQPLSEADKNNDNIISFWENKLWAEDHESVGDNPQFSDLGNLGLNTSLQYPTLLYKDIIGLNLQVSHRGIVGISKTIHVTPGHELSFLDNANVHLLNDSKLIVDAGATLVINDNDTIYGANLQNQIVVNGNIVIGENVCFTSDSEQGIEWQGLELNNHNLIVSLENVDFNNSNLTGTPKSLTLNNCDFSNASLAVGAGNVFIKQGIFTDAFAEIYYAALENTYATITNCNFDGDNNTESGIIIESYPIYTISGCTVSGYTGNGVEISNSGDATTGAQLITDNIITGNGTTGGTTAGLYIYHSYADVDNNVVVSYNPHGIQCLNNSQVSITGNRLAEYDYETQQIRDNEVNQVYATRGSFPLIVRWNAIVDEDNDCLFYYASTDEEPPYDVKYNYWGENFNAAQDLCPLQYFDYLPVWDLQPGIAPIESDALAFENANALVGSGNYNQAETAYQQIVNTWPESKYALASLKELFALEHVAGDDYTSLKNYYLDIDQNPELQKLARHLEAFCDVTLENWQPAIECFEGFIQNPNSYEDSIFAIIDLAHTYVLMELSGYKSGFTGEFSQYKFNTLQDFENSRDYHIQLLFNSNEKEALSGQVPTDDIGQNGFIIQNKPNPFSGSTKIIFDLKEAAEVGIVVVNHLGVKKEIISLPWVNKGIHHVNFTANGLSDGIYYCSLKIKGKIVDTQKMVYIK